MSKRKNLNRLLGAAALAMVFGPVSVYAQSATPDASGKTSANKAGEMSTTGQNETSSVKPPAAGTSDSSGSSGTSGSSASSGSSAMGGAGATKADAAGQTPANAAGKMSPTGQNETSSVKPMTGDTSGSSGTSGTSGSSSMGGAAATKEDAAGQTPANRAGNMSPTGQNETSSVKPKTSGASGTSGTSSSSGASGTSGTSSSAAASGSVSKADQKMMKDLAQANMSEIEAAKLAQEKSKDDQVRTFAQKMIDDHTKASDQLQQLAQSKNVTLPTTLDSKHKAEIKKLGALSGDKFDKKYLARGGVTDHNKAHALLNRIEKKAKDDDLKTLASTLMPTIDEHLQMAKQMKSEHASTATGASGTSGKAKTSGSSSSSSGGSGTSGSSSGK